MDKIDDTDQEVDLISLTDMFMLYKDVVTALKEKGEDAREIERLGEEIMKGIVGYLNNPTQENAENTLGGLRNTYLGLIKPEDGLYH